MTIDCHVHLDDQRLQTFLKSYESGASSALRVISNSVDVESSKRNLDLAIRFDSVSAFVGVHPELFQKVAFKITKDIIDEICNEIQFLSERSSGIGEIGLDPKYGSMDLQRHLLDRQLEIAESRENLALTLHTRETLSETLDALSRYQIRNSVLFHWFSGTEEELKRAHSFGYYTSFGLPVLYSKRIAKLVSQADQDLLLAETDSPIIFESISKSEPETPFGVSSVLFGMSILRGVPFEEMLEINENNANRYLKRKTH